MKFGIIGAGNWAAVHRQALLASGASLSAVLVSSDVSRARIQADWSVAASTKLEDFLGHDFEAVIICSPNYLHAEHALAMIAAEKHVLIEKPMAISLAGCDQIIAATDKTSRVVVVGLEMRVFQLFERVKILLEADTIGSPVYLSLDLWRRPFREGAGGWKADSAKVGSSILEEPVHYFDLARWYLKDFCGEPQTLSARATSRRGKEALWQNLDVRLGFATGCEALIRRSIAAFGHAIDLRIVGEKGALQASWEAEKDLSLEPTVRLRFHNSSNRDDPVQHVPMEQQSGHAFDVHRQTEAFIEAIQTGATHRLATVEDGRTSVALCLATEQSLETGQAIVL